ncbi:DUF7283 family protein [Salinirubrum litoreum]|uniref:Uncharacterized protein n=1 Tax=Salinirubrum litoreum TaxID=1126234 RepID=A0ABD5RAL5_9EURY|nr:hypothetical protein [Salinirubrum litoreum]
MFDAPVDAWYVWLGLAVASLAVFGSASSLPTTPPPDAAGVADTVDSVAADEYETTAEHPLSVSAVRVGPHRLALRNDAGTSHAEFAFGPVTPVARDSRLERVLHGTPVDVAFEDRRAFQQAVIDARTREPTWTAVDRSLIVRRVSWEGQDVTLVGV